MAELRRFELDELTLSPGTYFNPQTEVMIVVDDSPDVDHELFGGEEYEADEWVLVSEETPLDEDRRDELLERFRSEHHGGATTARLDDEDEDEDAELDPDEDDDAPELGED